jgi:hypothetical protein
LHVFFLFLGLCFPGAEKNNHPKGHGGGYSNKFYGAVIISSKALGLIDDLVQAFISGTL